MQGGGAAAGGAAAGAAASIANAVKASGVLVRVEPEDFMAVLARIENPLVVTARHSFFSPGFKYLAGYKGLAFYTKSRRELILPGTAEIVRARTIWVPS